MTNSLKLKTSKSNTLTIASLSSQTPKREAMTNSRNKIPSEQYSDILEPSVIYDGGVRYTKNTLNQEIVLGANEILARNKGNRITIKGVPVIIGKLNEREFRALPHIYKMSHTLKYTMKENAKDPTWAQLKSFLLSNVIFKNMLTGKAKYKTGEFMCQDFGMSLLNTAYASGIRCSDVSIIFKDGGSHTINMFDTTDRGWVFVDSSAGVVLSKKNFFGQGKSYTPDFAAMRSIEKRPSFAGHLKEKYFGEGLDLVQINW